MVLSTISYKHMSLTSKVNLTKSSSEKYKCMRLTTRLYGIVLNLKQLYSLVPFSSLVLLLFFK